MSKEIIKSKLKEARNSIKEKNYPVAIKICKEILQIDGKNYMAFLFLGAAFQDADKIEAANNLRLAVKVSTDPTQALQGLLNCCLATEIPDICKKLLKLTPEKFDDLHKKLLIAARGVDDLDKCIEILREDAELEPVETNSKRVDSAHFILAQIYLNHSASIPETLNELFSAAFSTVIATSDGTFDDLLDAYKSYLKILYKLKLIDRLVEVAQKMIDRYPTQTLAPLEWICKSYLENRELAVFKNIALNLYAESLMAEQPNSILGMAAKGVRSYEVGDFAVAKDILDKVNELQGNWSVCLAPLALVNLKVGAFLQAEDIFRQSKPTPENSRGLCEALVRQENKEKVSEAIQMCKEIIPKVEGEEQLEVIGLLARALVVNDQFDGAEKTISKVASLETDDNHFTSTLLSAFKSRTSGNFEQAIATLALKSYENCSFYLELGKSHFNLKNYEEALVAFLKATKLEPYNSDCFFQLAKIYSAHGDETRMRKCLEKSLSLNMQNKEAAVLLSRAYRNKGELDVNRTFLEGLVKVCRNSEKGWAWRQLGLNFLTAGNFTDAINAFRFALRYDATDVASWEGLADSYMARGSYSSSMKVYQKAIEMDEGNLYAKLQVGQIHAILMTFIDSIKTYEEILAVDGKYFPALKGIAESHFGLAKKYLGQRLIGRAHDHVQQAVDFVIQAIQLKPNFSCLWHVLANILDFAALLPLTFTRLNIPGSLVGSTDAMTIVAQEALFELASRCYCRAIKINADDFLLWYELAASYYHRAIKYDAKRKPNLQLALETAKNTITLNPTRWMSWNLLGVICSTKEINNLPLAQHAFIKAVTNNKKSYTSWTNLGILYLTQGQIKLANKAFGVAQQSDPNYLNAWAGQAIIAETISDVDEALDLFRHCTQLGFHPEAAIGYAHWVCSILEDPKNLLEPRFRYAIENMHAVPLALDSINWFWTNDDETTSLEGLSFLGYLSFRQGLWSYAVKAFEAALLKAKDKHRDVTLTNLGYCYLKVGESTKAAESFHSVTEATYKSTIGLALAYFKAEQFEEAYTVYDSALQWLASSDTEKSMILIATSAMVYAFQGPKDAKNVLFQCISLSSPPLEGLFSACALGILHQDMQLSELVLQELKKHENNPDECHQIAFLKSQIILSIDGAKASLRYLLSRIHVLPDRPLLRKVLASFLLKHFSAVEKYCRASARIARSSIALNLRNMKRMTANSAAKSLALASEALRDVDKRQQRMLAQKAVHVNPGCKDAWSALIACK